MPGKLITCGATGCDEDDADLADGIDPTFAEMCDAYEPNPELGRAERRP